MRNHESFAALIYVTDTEHEAVMRMYDWQLFRMDGDSQDYYKTQDSNGKIMYAAKQNEMGMTAAATLTMKLVEHFRPKYIIMPGIAAGAFDEEDDVQLYGDVILADMVWNYANGKYVSKEKADIIFGEIGFLPRPTYVKVDEELLYYFEKTVNSKKNENHVFIGAMASGSTVVANRAIIEKQIKGQFINTKGLEMEGYGVAYAAANATEPKPKAIIAKSICDFADSRKSDMYQKFAAHTSCEFVKLMLTEILE